MNVNRIILIDKPAGMSSFGVVARIRRYLSQAAGKRVKVGHTGTLDPFATGLLILVSGSETKNAGTFSKLDKEYVAVFRLGQISSTADPEGDITEVSSRVPDRAEIESVLRQFRGEIEQTPPVFSAIKINGQRAYTLARKGETVDIPKRNVQVFALELLDYNYPELKVRAHVSSGTYIRSLAVDVGEALGVGAYCTVLRRTKVSDWSVEQADTLSDFGITN